MSSHSKKWCTPGDCISIWYDYCLSVFSFKTMEKGKIYLTLETKTDYKECCRWIRTKYLLKIFQHFSGGLKAVLKTASMICIARSLLTVLYMETWTAAMWMKFFSWLDWAVCLTGFCWYRQTTMMCWGAGRILPGAGRGRCLPVYGAGIVFWRESSNGENQGTCKGYDCTGQRRGGRECCDWDKPILQQPVAFPAGLCRV